MRHSLPLKGDGGSWSGEGASIFKVAASLVGAFCYEDGNAHDFIAWTLAWREKVRCNPTITSGTFPQKQTRRKQTTNVSLAIY